MDSNIILYTTDAGNVSVQVQYEDGTFWLTQKRMAELFGVEVHTVNYHLKEIFQSGELQEDAVIRKIRITAVDGKNYLTNFYHLDAIIAVGYRVNSKQATQFRIWATKTLNEFIVKGYVLDKESLIKGPSVGHDYFKELLIEIREIRASEKRFYAKIKDIYATSVDYDKTADVTRDFFAMVQNKMLWAVTGQTAAEIIHSRANSEEINMGLTTWNGKKLLAPDVVIAKNYLKKDEMEKLDRLTVMYLDYAELQAERRIPMTMVDWATKLDGLLSLNEMEILTHKGKISKELAEKKAKAEYHKYDEKRRQQEIIDSDIEFAKEIEEIKRITKKDKE